MVYLIDDKKSRQSDYGWNDEKFASYKDVLCVIRNAEELISFRPNIFLPDNVILYHESFSSAIDNEKKHIINEFEQELMLKESHMFVARFSGSKFSRWVERNSCMLPPSFLYDNLDIFLDMLKEGDTDFMYLAYGKNYVIEKALSDRIDAINNNIENVNYPKLNASGHYFFALTNNNPLVVPFLNSHIEDNWEFYFFENNISDSNFHALVSKWFSNNQYDCIFIPLCFGYSLSDYLGLRLAMHIRFTDTPNKYMPLIIYGEAKLEEIQNCDCFDILKMAGVYYTSAQSRLLIDVSKKAEAVSPDVFRMELKKIHIQIPSNIGDSHSIANKWGVYRWSIALDDTDDVIEKISSDIINSLYFRYLTTVYPPSTISIIDKEKLKIDESINISDINVLYVDDEADDGWYELLCHILDDENNIHNVDCLGNELKSKTQEEIINYVLYEIKRTNANVVILDLRLHPKDFSADTNIKEITGFKLLEKIKEHNRGIQVLMFSATNKIWNLQALQKKEADGFIMKEAPENSATLNFTEESITNFVSLFSTCSKCIYKKKLWSRIQKINNKIDYLMKFNYIEVKYANNLLTLLSMFEDALFDSNQKHSLDNAFVHLFTTIELTANEWIGSRKDKNGIRQSYFKENGDPLYYFDIDNKSTRPIRELKGDLNWNQKIANTLYRVNTYDENIADLVDKRNNFTHPKGKLTYFTVDDILCLFTIVEKLIYHIEEK